MSETFHFKAYILLLPLLYFVLILIIGSITICIIEKDEIKTCRSFFGYLMLGCLYSGGYASISFGCSAFEGPRDENSNTKVLQPNFRLRLISKAVFAIVLVIFSIYFGYSTVPSLLSKDYDDIDLSLYNSTLSNKYNYAICENLCLRQGINQSEIEAYCNNLQYYISSDIHYGNTGCRFFKR